MTGAPNELKLLRAFVDAHAQPHPTSGRRESIMYIRHIGGSTLAHHALDEPPPSVDDALLEDMQANGLLTIDYGEHNWNITPTEFGRDVVDENRRINSVELLADTEVLVEAVSRQAQTENPLAWPAVRPVLAALRDYWQSAEFSPHGIPLPALLAALPDEYGPVFAATARALVDGEYLSPTGVLGGTVTDDEGRVTEVPGEVKITEKAHTILDGWPGAAPEEIVENLLAVLAVAAADEQDPDRKRRLESLRSTIRPGCQSLRRSSPRCSPEDCEQAGWRAERPGAATGREFTLVRCVELAFSALRAVEDELGGLSGVIADVVGAPAFVARDPRSPTDRTVFDKGESVHRMR